METIVVDSMGKFGPKVGGEFYSFSKFYKGPKELPFGIPIQVELYTSPKGKKYINEVDLSVTPAAAPAVKSAAQMVGGLPKQATEPKTEVKTDWAAKDRSQLVGGRSHDAVQLVHTSLTTDTPLPKVLEMYQQALESILDIAIEVK